ncbi:MAG TPA: hypothetical protein VMH35_24965 [Streptosporangiaceae bacterium]|nr:hypothetical protein [Streptosporangiaceae bacterium]
MPGSSPSPRRTDIYWRRRVIALAAAIGVLALVAWTLNGALDGGGAAKQAADTTHTGQHSQHGTPTTPAAAPTTPAGTPTPTATATPTPTPTHSAHAGAKHGSGHGGKQHGQAGAGRTAPVAGSSGTCPPGVVVLSLFTPRYRYEAGQAPRFQVDVVSTAPHPCSFDLGDKHVQLVIKAGGERRVWDSADCVQSSGQRMTKLARGVPQVLRISWDRKTSAPGCQQPAKPASPGTYTATARSGGLTSQSLIFVLAGPGIAVP